MPQLRDCVKTRHAHARCGALTGRARRPARRGGHPARQRAKAGRSSPDASCARHPADCSLALCLPAGKMPAGARTPTLPVTIHPADSRRCFHTVSALGNALARQVALRNREQSAPRRVTGTRPQTPPPCEVKLRSKGRAQVQLGHEETPSDCLIVSLSHCLIVPLSPPLTPPPATPPASPPPAPRD